MIQSHLSDIVIQKNKGYTMASRRLSFRLSEGSREAETWQKLKERSPDHKDQHIFNELLRREGLRLDNKETHSDILNRVETKIDILVENSVAGGKNDNKINGNTGTRVSS